MQRNTNYAQGIVAFIVDVPQIVLPTEIQPSHTKLKSWSIALPKNLEVKRHNSQVSPKHQCKNSEIIHQLLINMQSS